MVEGLWLGGVAFVGALELSVIQAVRGKGAEDVHCGREVDAGGREQLLDTFILLIRHCALR